VIRAGALTIGMLASGCSTAPAHSEALRASRIAALSSIIQACGLPESTFELVGGDMLQIKPPADARYESVDCALSRLKKAHLRLEMGFVGNEAYQEGQ
jgi:hypothetical protein